jgi:hypothetical protein
MEGVVITELLLAGGVTRGEVIGALFRFGALRYAVAGSRTSTLVQFS